MIVHCAISAKCDLFRNKKSRGRFKDETIRDVKEIGGIRRKRQKRMATCSDSARGLSRVFHPTVFLCGAGAMIFFTAAIFEKLRMRQVRNHNKNDLER